MRLKYALPLMFAIALHAQGGKMLHAAGAMDVKTVPDKSQAGVGRMMLDKHYHGGLDASSAGEMLYGGNPGSGVGGYVAMETVTGSLDGHAGTFQLMQWGTMEGGKYDMRIAVVPGSGTGALKGIAGTLKIDIAPDGKHTYTLDYTLPTS